MSGSIEMHLKDGVDLSGALVVVGAPGLGFVGSITARYLVEKLDMERVGGLHSSQFPPYAPVENGRPLHPVRMHHMETSCGLDLDCERLVVITSEIVAEPSVVHAMSEKLVAWAKEAQVEMMLLPDAILPGSGEEGVPAPGAEQQEPGTSVYGIATTQRAYDFLGRAELEPLKGGVMTGVTASLLGVSEHRGLDTVALLAESQPDLPDARAAARLVEVLDRILPGVKIEAEPLHKRAEEIEKSVRAVRGQLQMQAAQVGAKEQSVSMFH